MLFKLAFNKTVGGTLRVSATAGKGADHVLSIYDSDETFNRLVELSDLDEETAASMRSSAELAFGSANTPACCEEVDLTEAQLKILRLSEARRLHA